MDIVGAQSVGMPTAWLNRDGSSLVNNIKPLHEITSLSELLVMRPLEVLN